MVWPVWLKLLAAGLSTVFNIHKMFFEVGVKGASSFTDVKLSTSGTMNDIYGVVRQARLVQWMTYTVLYVRQLNCFVMFIWDLGPLTLVLVQMKGHVPHFAWLHGVVPGVLVVGWHSLDHTNMSWMLVSCLYVISGSWLKITANLAHDCKRLHLEWMILCTQLVDGWYTKLKLMIGLLLAAVLSLGRRVCWCLTWNGFYLLKSSSDYVFRVVSFRRLAVLFQVFVLVVHL